MPGCTPSGAPGRAPIAASPGRNLDQTWSNEDLGALAAGKLEPYAGEAAQREAFETLFRRLWRASVEWARTAYAGNRDLSEDAATQAWYRAWRYRTRYDPRRAAYATWLGAIVRNESADVRRSETRHRSRAGEVPEDVPDEHCVEEPPLSALSFVWEALRELESRHPEFAAVLLMRAQGYPDKQIAQRLGIERVGTVGSRIWRAKRFVAQRLAENGVVLLPGPVDQDLVREGLVPRCRTEGGCFYSLPSSGSLVALPQGAVRKGVEADPVCDAFLMSVWRREDEAVRVSGRAG